MGPDTNKTVDNESDLDNGGVIEFGLLPGFLGYHIRLAQMAIFKDFVTSLQQYEITPTTFGALVLIEANPGIKQSELAEAIQLDRSTVVPLIDRLEKRQLVARERLANDRRANALRVTAKGVTLLDELKPLVIEHERRLISRLSDNEQKKLIDLLGKIFPDQRISG